jgi:hypothetical protein
LGAKYLFVLCAGFRLLLGEDTLTSSLSSALVQSVTKLASITFLSLAFSYWIDYLGFITERKLAVVLITPSLGVPNWSVIYIINTTPSSVLGQDSSIESKIASKQRMRGDMVPTTWSRGGPALSSLFPPLLRSPLTSSSHGLLFLEKMMWQKVWVV